MKKIAATAALALALTAGGAVSAQAYDFEIDFDSNGGRAGDILSDKNLPSRADSGLGKALNRSGSGDTLGKGRSVVEDD